MKRIIHALAVLPHLIVLLVLLCTPIISQGQTSFYSDRAIQQVNQLGIPNPVLSSIPYAFVRVCNLPLTQGSPCLPLASITDINGNPLSNSIGSNFGQTTTDATGRFTIGCTLGANYQVQVQASASNTPALNYPITCPGVGNNPLFNSLTTTGPANLNGGGALSGNFSGPTTLTGNLTAIAGLNVLNAYSLISARVVDGNKYALTAAGLNSAISDAGGGGTVIVPPGSTVSATTTITVGSPTHLYLWGNLSSSASPIFTLTGTGGVTIEGSGNGSTATTATTITQTTSGGKFMTIGDGTNPFRGMVLQNMRLVASTPSATSTIQLNANIGNIKFRDLFLQQTGGFDGTAGNYVIIIHDHVRVDSTVNTGFNYNCAVSCAGIHFWGTYANATSGSPGIGYDISNATASFVSTHGDSNTSAYRFAGVVRMYGSDSENNSVAGINIVGSGNYEIVGHHSGNDQLPVQINAAGANVTITDLSSAATVGASSIAVSAASTGDNKLFSTAGLDKAVTVTAGGILQIYSKALTLPETAAPSGVANADLFWPDATAHHLLMNNNNGGADYVGNSLTQFCGTTSTCSHTNPLKPQIVVGSAPLVSGTPSTVTITGISPAFTSTTSYFCTITNQTNAANSALKVANVSGSSFTITGPNTITDVIGYVCAGN